MSLNLFANSIARFVDLPENERRAIESLPYTTRKVKRRREAIRCGDTPSYLYVVLDGWVGRYGLRSDGSRRITGLLLPGDFCGIHAVCHVPMDQSIVAFTDCRLALIEVEHIEALLAGSPAVAKALWHAKLVDEAISRKWLLNSQNSLQSLAHLLCELHERQRLSIDGASSFALPLIQEDVGDALGITAVHTNRTLRQLREMGLVRHEHGFMHIIDIAELRQVANFEPEYLSLPR